MQVGRLAYILWLTNSLNINYSRVVIYQHKILIIESKLHHRTLSCVCVHGSGGGEGRREKGEEWGRRSGGEGEGGDGRKGGRGRERM